MCVGLVDVQVGKAAPVLESLRRTGFVRVRGTPITRDLKIRAIQMSSWLFALPPNIKQTIRTPTSHRGYFDFKHVGGLNDLIEGFNIGHQHTATSELRKPYFDRLGFDVSKDVLTGDRVIEHNQWPLEHTDSGILFKNTMLEVWDAMERSSIVLLDLIVSSLVEEKIVPAQLKPTLLAAHSRNMHVMELKLYPSLQSSTPPIRFAEHIDLSTLTLLINNDLGSGLEFFDESQKRWVSIPESDPDDSVLVNVGDFLTKWTNGALPSTKHRVVGTPQSRQSLVFFFTPNWEATFENSDGSTEMVGDSMPLGF
eukprot:c1171_g1_i1.p1 GENE.c1171_g1_i1~~c1171_g1_i1.p1  ORF type:complete len:310 (+),score=62.83 c1171_g1_i1:33-962(+)